MSHTSFTLSSTNLSGQIDEKQVFNDFGATGNNISPQLMWENAPEGTKSFAITMYDKDAPTESGWWHWLCFDIPTSVNKLEENAGDIASGIMPKNVIQGKNDYGIFGYG
jgi:Raf kinase inhibitor-like YbhB/YbcL family protein